MYVCIYIYIYVYTYIIICYIYYSDTSPAKVVADAQLFRQMSAVSTPGLPAERGSRLPLLVLIVLVLVLLSLLLLCLLLVLCLLVIIIIMITSSSTSINRSSIITSLSQGEGGPKAGSPKIVCGFTVRR